MNDLGNDNDLVPFRISAGDVKSSRENHLNMSREALFGSEGYYCQW